LRGYKVILRKCEKIREYTDEQIKKIAQLALKKALESIYFLPKPNIWVFTEIPVTMGKFLLQIIYLMKNMNMIWSRKSLLTVERKKQDKVQRIKLVVHEFAHYFLLMAISDGDYLDSAFYHNNDMNAECGENFEVAVFGSYLKLGKFTKDETFLNLEFWNECEESFIKI
jgi:hypothetical protein